MSPSRPSSQNRLLDLEAELFGQRSLASQQAQGQARKPKIPPHQPPAPSLAQSPPQFSYTLLADRLRGTATPINRSEPASVPVQFSRPITRIPRSVPQAMPQVKPNAIEWRKRNRFTLAELEPMIPEQQSSLEPEEIHLQTRIIQQRMIPPEEMHSEAGMVNIPLPEATHSLENHIPLQRLLSQSIAIWQPASVIDIHSLRRILLNSPFELAALPPTEFTDDASQQDLSHNSLAQRSLDTNFGLDHTPFQCCLNYLSRLLKFINFLAILPQRRSVASPQLKRIQALMAELDAGSLGDRPTSPLRASQTSRSSLTTIQPQAEEDE